MNRVFFPGGENCFCGERKREKHSKNKQTLLLFGGEIPPPPPKGPEKTLTVKDTFPDSLVPRPPLQRGAWVEGGSWYEMILLIDRLGHVRNTDYSG